MSRDLFRDLVAFERVLERSDFKTKLVREIDQHQDLAGDVAVRVYVAFAFENLDERFELQIATRRDQVLVVLRRRTIFIPRSLVITRARERIANRLFNTHARVWITARDARLVGRPRALHVFAERKLYPRHRSWKQKLTRRPAILDLHNRVQAADGIRRSMQQIQ